MTHGTQRKMASILSSCTPIKNTPSTSSSNSNVSRQLLVQSNRFRVSCNGGQSGKVDRRNMLLGLGGLCGAANLVPSDTAWAAPIQAPQLDKCGTATNLNTGKEIKENCCPPVSPQIIDYRLPPVSQMKLRRSAHLVDPEYIFKYNTAIDLMKRLPPTDPRSFMQQANVHCAYCNGAYDQPNQGTKDLQVHFSWLFFPFHRWYIYFYERILGKLIGDPTFALPFWNWDNPIGMTIPPMFLDPQSALYDAKRNPASRTGFVDLGLTGETNQQQIASNNLSIIYSEVVRSVYTVYDFMGAAYREGDTDSAKGQGSSERGSHTSVHRWVGEQNQEGRNLGNFFTAGRDPLFYCHHTNVDRMWTLWQYFIPDNKVPDKRILDPDFLNASFVFYDENARLVRVTVKDCLDNLRMGYDYERIDLPWLDYRPPPQAAKAKVRKLSKLSSVPTAASIFPLVLDKVVRFSVPKTKKGKADELLVLEDIEVDNSKFLKFDVFVNDEDDNLNDLRRASYAGTYAQVPHKTREKTTKSSIRLKLTELYEDEDIEDDDTVLVTLVPRHQGPGVTIGGIKIIEAPPAKSS